MQKYPRYSINVITYIDSTVDNNHPKNIQRTKISMSVSSYLLHII